MATIDTTVAKNGSPAVRLAKTHQDKLTHPRLERKLFEACDIRNTVRNRAAENEILHGFAAATAYDRLENGERPKAASEASAARPRL